MYLCKESINTFRCTSWYNMIHCHRVSSLIIQKFDHNIIKYLLQRKQQRHINYKFLRKRHRTASYSPNHTNMSKQYVRRPKHYFGNFFTLFIMLPSYYYLCWFNSIAFNFFKSSIAMICTAIWWMSTFLHLLINIYLKTWVQVHYHDTQFYSCTMQWINNNNINLFEPLSLINFIISRIPTYEDIPAGRDY